MRLARRITIGIALALVVVLVITGAWLWFHYRPAATSGWNDPLLPRPAQTAIRVRIVHRSASTLLLWDTVALLVLVVASSVRRWWPAAAGAVVLAGLFGFTGYLLPWDQLALWAVTVGTGMGGVTPVFGDDVRFVLLGGAEVSPGTYRAWAIVHAGALPVLGLLPIAVIGHLRFWGRRRERAVAAASPERIS